MTSSVLPCALLLAIAMASASLLHLCSAATSSAPATASPFSSSSVSSPASSTPSFTSSSSPQSVPSTLVLSTGFTVNGSLITVGGQADGHWRVFGQPAQTVYPGNADWPGSSWAANDASSTWISVNAFTSSPSPCPYTFVNSFSLIHYNLSAITINGSFTGDNVVTVLVNGYPVASFAGGWGSLHPFSVTSASVAFVEGLNNLSLALSCDDSTDGARISATLYGSIVTNPTPPVTSVFTPSSITSSCPTLLTPTVAAGTTALISLTDPCALSSLTAAEVEMYEVAAVCRFLPSGVQSPAVLYLNSSATANAGAAAGPVVVCPLPLLLSAGAYVVQLSLDGGASVVPPALSSASVQASILIPLCGVLAVGHHSEDVVSPWVGAHEVVEACSAQLEYDEVVDGIEGGGLLRGGADSAGVVCGVDGSSGSGDGGAVGVIAGGTDSGASHTVRLTGHRRPTLEEGEREKEESDNVEAGHGARGQGRVARGSGEATV